MKIISVFELSGKSYGISSEIVKRSSLREYQLDAYSFYQRFGKVIPLGIGYELQVLNNPEINAWHEKEHKLLDNGRLIGLHVHQGNDRLPYVCYPLQIKTFTEAVKIHKEWARIMFAQIFFGLTDSQLFKEAGNNGSTTAWAAYADRYFKEHECRAKDFFLVPLHGT